MKKLYLPIFLLLLFSGCVVVKAPVTLVKTTASVTKKTAQVSYKAGKLVYKGGKKIVNLATPSSEYTYECDLEENHTPDKLEDIFTVIESEQ